MNFYAQTKLALAGDLNQSGFTQHGFINGESGSSTFGGGDYGKLNVAPE